MSSGVVLTKNQLDALKEAVKNYEKWLRTNEAHVKQGDELLKKVKTCSASSGNNWSLVKVDVDSIYAHAFRELDL
jgi:uncharacterized protein HemX